MAKGQIEDSKLSEVEKIWLGQPSIRKILVKVVQNRPTPLEKNHHAVWFRAATCSAITQSGGKVSDFNRLNIAIDPMKPRYQWIIVPVGASVFKALAGVHATLDPKSGTLVLF